jgi:hypothetical protein
MAEHKDVKSFLAGGFADFLIYLIELPDPIVVGGGYERDKIVAALSTWAAERNFDISSADLNQWRRACKMNVLGDPE